MYVANAEGEATVVLTLECAEEPVDPEPTTPSEPITTPDTTPSGRAMDPALTNWRKLVSPLRWDSSRSP